MPLCESTAAPELAITTQFFLKSTKAYVNDGFQSLLQSK